MKSDMTPDAEAKEQTRRAQAEVHSAVLRYILEQADDVNGGLVQLKPTFYNWRSYEIFEALGDLTPAAHVLACGIASGHWEDKDWQEFAGTFAEYGDQFRHGIDAVVTCKCGRVTYRTFRYTGSHGDLLRGITGVA